MSLTMDNLIQNFNCAKKHDSPYVAVLIAMEGFPKAEIIINQAENIDTKLEYYQKTYDENLNHKFAKGIKIVGMTHGDSFDDIEFDLINN